MFGFKRKQFNSSYEIGKFLYSQIGTDSMFGVGSNIYPILYQGVACHVLL